MKKERLNMQCPLLSPLMMSYDVQINENIFLNYYQKISLIFCIRLYFKMIKFIGRYMYDNNKIKKKLHNYNLQFIV